MFRIYDIFDLRLVVFVWNLFFSSQRSAYAWRGKTVAVQMLFVFLENIREQILSPVIL
jgi:membrane-anchored protein YejM (alkaline phosphatase superfamily)